MFNRFATVLVALVAFAATASAQFKITQKSRPKARVVIVKDDFVNRKAAQILVHYINKISGASLPIEVGEPPRKGAIVIGETTSRASRDGFSLECDGRELHIRSGGGMGSVYGVETLLEQYFGVNYWAYRTVDYPWRPTLSLGIINHAETPAFRFRQTYSYGNDDKDYVLWYRLNDHSEVFASDLWVHTFDRILPASVYGEKHPEYYSFINGMRRPGNHSQWCLTNDELFEIVCQKVDSIFKANPGRTMMSISQNDGNNTYCQCPKCKAVDEYEGTPSGNLIRFVNKLAWRFPDKRFSTLAYLYSMHPPKHVRPLPNVNIMLCDIDCKREVPLTQNVSGRDFVNALEGWSRISDNIFVWDYGINFDNMIVPFPNFHILQPNLQLFKKNHATMVFEQVNGKRGTDFAELRAYMIGKLMWNPDLNADSLMRTFLDGYYGGAGKYLYQYLKEITANLVRSGIDLWIYDSPVSHKNGMLNDSCMSVYNRLFEQAEAAVKADSARLARVRIARLPLQYSELEIARTRAGGDASAIKKLLATFRERCDAYGVTELNERNNHVDDYCKLYEQRFLPHANTNKAAGARVIWGNPPAKRYQKIADKALTDGLYGGASFVESWVGWEGEDADFTLDMGKEQSFTTVSADFLQQVGAWVLLPKSVSYSYSSDGKSFKPLGTFTFTEDRSGVIRFVKGPVSAPEAVSARYIRVNINGIGLCPSWHYGVGYPAWFFIDEVEVR